MHDPRKGEWREVDALCRRMARAYARRMAPRFEFDDLYDEAVAVVLEKWNRYDPSRAGIVTYFSKWIRDRYQMQWLRQGAFRETWYGHYVMDVRMPVQSAEVVAEELQSVATEDLSPEKMTEISLRDCRFTALLQCAVPSERQRGMLLQFHGHERTATEIGRELGISRQAVDQIIHKGERKLREFFAEAGVRSLSDMEEVA